MIKLGQKVRDVVSGFTGIAVARTEWLNGCMRIYVQPAVGKDGKPADSCTFDEETLQVIDEKPIKLPMQKEKKTGGGGRDDAAAQRR